MNKASQNHCRSQRLGFTLIEVIGTLSVLLAIALAGVGMLGSVTRIGLERKQADQARVDMARLATKFRADVHEADEIGLDDRGQWIDLTIGDQVVRYQFHSDSQVIVRRRTDLNERSPIDSFGMTERCRPGFDVQDRQVILRLTAEDARNPWIIEAVRS